jgi:peptide/nickel transport system substrate-binding protein
LGLLLWVPGDRMPSAGREEEMSRNLCAVAAATVLLMAMSGVDGTFAQKQGGVLKMYHFDSPASMSTHEEVSFAALGPTMGLFNNLVMFDQHVAQNSLQSIVPDLARDWSWDENKTQLTFDLRHGVKWHDGRPFTAKDVKCTWDALTGKSSDKFRLNPRKSWYQISRR